MKEAEEEFEEIEELEQGDPAKRKSPKKINYIFKKAAKKRGIWQGEEDDDE